jgi:hypothetical protein
MAVPPRLEPVNQAPRPDNQGEIQTYRLPREDAEAPSDAVIELACMTWAVSKKNRIASALGVN